jgi:type II secretory pathway component GspD/PulD (secretin)
MSLLNSLQKLKEIEHLLSAFYDDISNQFKGRNKEISDYFEILSRREASNENEAELTINLYKESCDQAIEKPKTEKMMNSILKKFHSMQKFYLANNQSVDVYDLLKMVKTIEKNLEKKHQVLNQEISNPELKDFISRLTDRDNNHVTRLKQLMGKYKQKNH